MNRQFNFVEKENLNFIDFVIIQTHTHMQSLCEINE